MLENAKRCSNELDDLNIVTFLRYELQNLKLIKFKNEKKPYQSGILENEPSKQT